MLVGLTYDLREDYLREGFSEEETAEFDRNDTIDAIEKALANNGYRTRRIGNIRSLIGLLAQGDRWDMVFNIAEGMYGIAREAQVPAILDAYGIPYTFSDPMVLALTLHKGMTKRIIRDWGIPTPAFAVIETAEDIAAVKLRYPLFAKPVAEGTGKGITEKSKIASPGQLEAVSRDILARYRQPVLVEEYLPGREFTVGITGTGRDSRAVAVLEIILKENAQKDVYSYVNKEFCEELVEYRLAHDDEAERAAETALRSWTALGCRDAGRVDLRSDGSGVPNFIEVNPLAGIHPLHSDLPIMCTLAGIPYDALIGSIMESARKRTG